MWPNSLYPLCLNGTDLLLTVMSNGMQQCITPTQIRLRQAASFIKRMISCAGKSETCASANVQIASQQVVSLHPNPASGVWQATILLDGQAANHIAT